MLAINDALGFAAIFTQTDWQADTASVLHSLGHVSP
jgi:hypothetical protein